MNGFFPLDVMEIDAKAFDVFWRTLFGLLDEHRQRQEAELQRAILQTSEKKATLPTNTSKRVLPRISRISAATRAFLSNNKPLTFFSSIPMVQQMEIDMARNFVRSFQDVEHEIRHTTPNVSLVEWREQNFRDKLSQIASKDQVVYQALALAGTLPKSSRKQVVEQLSGQLMCGHIHNSTPQQMG